MKLISKISTALLAVSALVSTWANATIVEFVTSQGNIRVNLHDQSTPKTVDNFLGYVNDGDYQDSVIHRVESNFVVQGGGATYNDGFDHESIESNGAVENEPVWSNAKGTIAMAKVAGNPNSATSQWFFNLADNSANLDVQNGGFTVFGQVFEEDMAVLEAIEELSRCGSTPMVDYSAEQCTTGEDAGYDNFVIVYRIDIIDSTTVTDADLVKVPNTLIQIPDEDDDNDSDSSGGGSLFWLPLIALLAIIRRTQK